MNNLDLYDSPSVLEQLHNLIDNPSGLVVVIGVASLLLWGFGLFDKKTH